MAFFVTGSSPDYDLALCLDKGWAIQFTCLDDICRDRRGGARRVITWGQTKIGEQDPAVTLGQLAERAICSECGGRHGHVGTINGGWQGRGEHAH